MGVSGSEEFSIKQVADVFGNTRGAIRFYQEKGLVEPRVNEKGFRFYTVDDLFQLLYLKGFAAMSFSLDEVACDLRRESDASVEDVVALADRHIAQIEDSLARQRRQLAELAAFRSCLLDARTGVIRYDVAEEYWALDQAQVAAMMHEEPGVLKSVVALLPGAMVGSAYDLHNPSRPVTAQIRLRASIARKAGLERTGRFAVLGPSDIAVRTVRVEGDFSGGLWEEALSFADDVRASGREPTGEVFNRLAFVHEEGGMRVGYHIFIVGIESKK